MDDRRKDAKLREALAVLVHRNGGEVAVNAEDTAEATGALGGPHGVGFEVDPVDGPFSEYEVRLVARDRREEPERTLDE
ncbi:MAG TPA: hypothetical protein VFS32_08565 [Candidatus Limnocylindrales bacterium]|nr:hypothetical protein [Candidatus Limnocylindrales bacterium]